MATNSTRRTALEIRGDMFMFAAANCPARVCAVQAIAAQSSGRGSFHGTQYHPEHTFAVSAALVEMRAAELVDEGLGASLSEIVAIAADYRALDAEPSRRDLIWRYGIAREIMDPVRRTAEIGNWLRTVVAPRRV